MAEARGMADVSGANRAASPVSLAPGDAEVFRSGLGQRPSGSGGLRHIRQRPRLLAVALLVLVSLITLNPAAVASGPTLPSQDPFYTYSGSKPLSAIPPGTVLKHRSAQLAFGAGNSTPIRAEQLLYRTTGQLGRATVTVTTVLEPTPTPVLPRIVDYLSFYDGLGSQCDPSYTLAGGAATDSTYQQEADEEELLIGWYLSQ